LQAQLQHQRQEHHEGTSHLVDVGINSRANEIFEEILMEQRRKLERIEDQTEKLQK